MNKKLIISLAMIGVVAVIAIGATTAYFSNTETSSGNTFVAGAIDLKVDSQCTYNGDSVDSCNWKLTDLDGELFFDFDDVKPGDSGEDTISLHVDTNPAWICAEISDVINTENGCNPPEAKIDTTCEEGELGELQDNLLFSVWMDPNCNNIYDDNETYIIQNAKVTDVKWPIADSQHGEAPITDACIGVAWNVPSTVGNEIQGDSVTGDVTFKAYQARNNDGFLCYPGDGCFDQADVMLVLDRSGSINPTELSQLKTAAHTFVTALNPDGGVHMGQTSFDGTGSFDLHLTGSQPAINAAIDALTSGGTTDLEAGITLAIGELDDANIIYERPSVSDYIVIITDGNPNVPSESQGRTDAENAANAARAAGIEVYVVGVGGDVDATWLRTQIADDAAHYFGIGAYDDLEAILTSIANCEAPPAYCGDGNVDPGEECEADADCTTGEVCNGCVCEPECTPQLTALFSDGFETGNFSVWTSVDNDWHITTSGEYSGIYAAFAADQGSNDDVLRKALSTSGYDTIAVSYWYKIDPAIESGEHVRVEWSNNGSTWQQLVDYTNVGVSTWTQASFSVPAGANNNTSFQIRFRASDLQQASYDKFMLDDVLVTGYTICP